MEKTEITIPKGPQHLGVAITVKHFHSAMRKRLKEIMDRDSDKVGTPTYDLLIDLIDEADREANVEILNQ